MHGVEKSEGGPVRARLDLFGRLLARNFSRQTRRPASWRRLRNTRAHTHGHRVRIERGWCWCANESQLPFPSPFCVFRSANKGSNSVDFRTCFSITIPREAAATAGKEEKKRRDTSKREKSILKYVTLKRKGGREEEDEKFSFERKEGINPSPLCLFYAWRRNIREN